MNFIREDDYVINGIKSWCHCIRLQDNPTQEKTQLLYHYHKYIELLFSLSTNATVWLAGQRLSFHTGDLIIINSDELHGIVFHTYSEYICIKFSPEILYTPEQSLLEYKYVIPFLSKDANKKKFESSELKDTLIPALFTDIMQEWQEKNTAFELAIRSNILKIFSILFRMNEGNNFLLPNFKLTDALKCTIAYVNEHFNTITENEAASFCGLSYHHFSTVFKNATGQNFNTYLTAIKLREAEKQLIFSDKSITDIAYDTGFSNTSHFIKRFQEYKHITPRQFRIKCR